MFIRDITIFDTILRRDIAFNFLKFSVFDWLSKDSGIHDKENWIVNVVWVFHFWYPFFSLFGTRKQSYFCFKVLDKNYYEMKLIVIIILCEYTLNVKRNLRDIHILQDMQSNFPEEVSEYSVNCKATTDRALLWVRFMDTPTLLPVKQLTFLLWELNNDILLF